MVSSEKPELITDYQMVDAVRDVKFKQVIEGPVWYFFGQYSLILVLKSTSNYFLKTYDYCLSVVYTVQLEKLLIFDA